MAVGSRNRLKDIGLAAGGRYCLLKLDVEGMENNVLHSDRVLIHRERPIVWSECNETTNSLGVLSFFGKRPMLYISWHIPRIRSRNIKMLQLGFSKQNSRCFARSTSIFVVDCSGLF